MKRRTADIPQHMWPQLRRVGFWHSDQQPELADPKEHVVTDWSEEERWKVVEYLTTSYLMPYTQGGPSWCRFGCSPRPADIGTQDLTDGTWVFPEGLVHYVRMHAVKPDEDFLVHIRRLDYTVPALAELK